ncbi:MAG: hypothetical protein QM777_14705 [Pseudorhodoferax sp.]
MRPLAFAAAILFGAVLHAAVVLLAGVTAAVAVPPGYFAWFGRAQAGPALGLLHLMTFAVPAAIVNAGGLLAAERLLRGSAKAVVLGYLAGFLCAIAGSALTLWLESEGARSLAQVLHGFVPTWWALPGLLLPWTGFAAAAWLLRRRAAEPDPGTAGGGAV